MDVTEQFLQNDCSFNGIQPLILPMPYPPIRAREENQFYANLLTLDYCGSVSELTAVAQYIHGESRLCCSRCETAKTIMSMAMAEMMHLQKLGEMILLLGGSIDFSYKTRMGSEMWTPRYANLSTGEAQIISAGVRSERETIAQYQEHIGMIEDDYVNALLKRIIQDEEYHIMILQMIKL